MLKLVLPGLCAAAIVAGLARGGDPERGALVWTSNGCGACHALKKTGSTGAAGPNLDRWLIPDSRRAKIAPGELVARRVFWGGRGMQAYGQSLSRQELDDLVSFLAGTDAPSGTPAPLAPFPAPPPRVTAPAAAVKRWTARVGRANARGAALFADVGCLSCHTYAGSGVRRRGAPDLTREGRRKRAAAIAAYARRGSALMPMYADLGADALLRIGAFLSASR